MFSPQESWKRNYRNQGRKQPDNRKLRLGVIFYAYTHGASFVFLQSCSRLNSKPRHWKSISTSVGAACYDMLPWFSRRLPSCSERTALPYPGLRRGYENVTPEPAGCHLSENGIGRTPIPHRRASSVLASRRMRRRVICASCGPACAPCPNASLP